MSVCIKFKQLSYKYYEYHKRYVRTRYTLLQINEIEGFVKITTSYKMHNEKACIRYNNVITKNTYLFGAGQPRGRKRGRSRAFARLLQVRYRICFQVITFWTCPCNNDKIIYIVIA